MACPPRGKAEWLISAIKAVDGRHRREDRRAPQPAHVPLNTAS